MKRTLFLHVGYGKTGSSAIQSWLANNAALLAKQGFSYTIKDSESLNYRVSSGNGGPLSDFLTGALTEAELEEHYFNHAFPNTIISSETLFLSPDSISRLTLFCQKQAIQLNVLAYVRDVADCTYSAYVQSVKRHCSLISYSDYLNTLDVFSHIAEAKMMDQRFENITFTHYNTHKADVLAPFIDWANIESSELTALGNRKVNRTLTSDEIQVVQHFVRWRKRYFDDLEFFNISMLISDWLVNDYPDKHTDASVSQVHLNLLVEKFGHVVDDFNHTIGKRHGVSLSCGHPEVLSESSSNKQEVPLDHALLETVLRYVLSREDVGDKTFRISVLIEAYKLMPDTVEKMLAEPQWACYSGIKASLATLATLTPKQVLGLESMYTSSAAKPKTRYELQAQDYVLFRDAAIELEQTKIELAYSLMSIAQKGRPNGKLILSKLNQYKNKLRS